MKQGVRWGSRVVAGWALGVVLAGCGAASEPEDPECRMYAGLRELAFQPKMDAYVVEDEGGRVVGTERKLVADNLSRRSAFLRFDIAKLPGPVLRATLRLYALDGSTDGPKLYPATVHWSEDDLTWEQNTSLAEAPLGDVDLVPHGSWVEYDVTSAVKGTGIHGFALVTESRNGVDFASKEHARKELAPRLVLTVDAPAGSDCDPDF